MSANWNDFRESLNLTQEEEDEISLEKDIINAIIDLREQNNLIPRTACRALWNESTGYCSVRKSNTFT